MAEVAPKPLIFLREGQEASGNDSITYAHGHPAQNILAVGDTAGHITIYEFSPGEESKANRSIEVSARHSCRILHFIKDGTILFVGMEDGKLSLVDVESGTISHSFRGHKDSPYSILQLDENVIATGDDGGCIKLWDIRSSKTCTEWKASNDFISDMAPGKNCRSLLATCGDGKLYKMDWRMDWREKKSQQSDTNESELLCVDLVKGGDKVVCGDGEGALMLYNWGLWEDITDRFPVHSQSVDCLLPINDSVICTGCMDGWVRSIHILPNQLIGLVGQHLGGFPVEHMCMSHDSSYLISTSQDSCHFWPVSQIPSLPGQESDAEEEEEETVVRKRKKRKRKQKHIAAEKLVKHKRSNDFFADL